MTPQNQTQQLRMGGDYRNYLLIQIELLRCVISHEELSKRLGDATERCLARYVAGKTHLREDEFGKIAKALTIDARMLAQAWAASLGLRLPDKNAVSWMVDRAYRHWRRHSRLAARRVPPSPSPMTVIRAKYADRLPRQTPPLWFNSFRNNPETYSIYCLAYDLRTAYSAFEKRVDALSRTELDEGDRPVRRKKKRTSPPQSHPPLLLEPDSTEEEKP